jgi:hypothetical protein
MLNIRRSFPVLVVSAVALLSACATTTMRSVRPEPEYNTARFHKALVIAIVKMPGLRERAEDEFVKQWKKRGVQAAASHAVMPPDLPLEKAKVGPFAKTQGYDTVLVMRTLGTQNIDPHIKGEEFTADPSTGSVDNLGQYFDTAVASPAYSENYRMAAVVCRIFDVATEKKVWEGISQTLVAEDVLGLVPSYVKTILGSIYAAPKSSS